jgi:hypothetical protein
MEDRDPMVRGCKAPLALHAACSLRATVAVSQTLDVRDAQPDEELNVDRGK